MIHFDFSSASAFVTKEELDTYKNRALEAKNVLLNGAGAGAEATGWLDLPVSYDKEEFERIKIAAEKIRNESDVLLVIGIGGSYLGARAAIEALTNSFYNLQNKDARKRPQIFFCGNSLSAKYVSDLIDYIKDKDFSINVISKSGTTTEPAIAMRIFSKLLEEKYGKQGAADRIYATTDKAKGALKNMADQAGYQTFVVPDDVGGRYSVLSAVGLLPIAAAGIDIDAMMAGAAAARSICLDEDYENSPALNYAVARNIFFDMGKSVEMFSNYEPSFHYVSEWWKQLFGESEGKDKKGLYPAAADFTTELHSIGQFIQDGSRVMFETVLSIDESDYDLKLDYQEDNSDGLNYLADKKMAYINQSAMKGTIVAHRDGGTPTIIFHIKKQDAFHLGALFYIFEFACGVSGYMMGINPFNQPGVEAYKNNMFAILGKPGYEDAPEVK